MSALTKYDTIGPNLEINKIRFWDIDPDVHADSLYKNSIDHKRNDEFGEPTKVVVGRPEVRSQKKERSKKMSREQSDGEYSVVGTGIDRFVDATAGAVGLDVVMPNLGEQRRLEPPGGAKLKWPRYGLLIPQTPGPRGQLPGVGAQPVGSGDGRFAFEMPSSTYPGPDRQLPGIGTHAACEDGKRPVHVWYAEPDVSGTGQATTGYRDTAGEASISIAFGMPTPAYPRSDRHILSNGTQPGLDQFRDGLPDMTDLGPHDELDNEQKDMIQFSHPRLNGQSTLVRQISPVCSKPVVFTSTKVPKFCGMTSCDQYRQVFEAIVWSNGWDDATVVLQLLSHLQGDVALLVPQAKRTMRVRLIGALMEHYGS